jgi:hypothetical protein
VTVTETETEIETETEAETEAETETETEKATTFKSGFNKQSLLTIMLAVLHHKYAHLSSLGHLVQ